MSTAQEAWEEKQEKQEKLNQLAQNSAEAVGQLRDELLALHSGLREETISAAQDLLQEIRYCALKL